MRLLGPKCAGTSSASPPLPRRPRVSRDAAGACQDAREERRALPFRGMETPAMLIQKPFSARRPARRIREALDAPRAGGPPDGPAPAHR